MKFRVERDVLGEAVAWVARALPSRPVVPVLSGLLLRAAEDGLTLSCFDYEVSARSLVAADVAEPGAALVPGRLLAEITRSLPAHPAEFSLDGDMVTLACGSAEFALVSLPLQDYPELPQPPEAAGTVDGGALAAAAAQVVPSASRDDTLPMLTGVYLDIDGPVMTLVATDRYRMAVRQLPWSPADPSVRVSVLVPARTLADVGRTMAPGVPVRLSFGAAASASPSGDSASGESASGGTASGGTASGSAEGRPGDGRTAVGRPADGMVGFEGGGRRLTARLIAGDFIKYRSRFPASYGSQAEVPAGPFIEAVRRVSLVAERATPVRLSFGVGEVVIEAQAEGRARATESVPASFSGDERIISFNPHYLLDGLTAAAVPGEPRAAGVALAAAAAGPDAAAAAADPDAAARRPALAEPRPGRIRLQFTSPARPALITWADDQLPTNGEAGADSAASDDGETADGGDPPFRYLVVPLRVAAWT